MYYKNQATFTIVMIAVLWGAGAFLDATHGIQVRSIEVIAAYTLLHIWLQLVNIAQELRNHNEKGAHDND